MKSCKEAMNEAYAKVSARDLTSEYGRKDYFQYGFYEGKSFSENQSCLCPACGTEWELEAPQRAHSQMCDLIKQHEAEIALLIKCTEQDGEYQAQLEADLAECRKTIAKKDYDAAGLYIQNTDLIKEIAAELNDKYQIVSKQKLIFVEKVNAQESIIKKMEEALKFYADGTYDYKNVAQQALTALKEFREKSK